MLVEGPKLGGEHGIEHVDLRKNDARECTEEHTKTIPRHNR